MVDVVYNMIIYCVGFIIGVYDWWIISVVLIYWVEYLIDWVNMKL